MPISHGGSYLIVTGTSIFPSPVMEEPGILRFMDITGLGSGYGLVIWIRWVRMERQPAHIIMEEWKDVVPGNKK